MFMSPVIFQILPMQFLLTNLWLLPKTEARLKNNQYPLKTLYMSEVLCAECYHLEFSTVKLYEVYNIILSLQKRKQLMILQAAQLLSKYYHRGSGVKHYSSFFHFESFPQMKSYYNNSLYF